MISLFAEEPKKDLSTIAVVSAFEATGRMGLLRDSAVISKRGYAATGATSAIDIINAYDDVSRFELSCEVLSKSLKTMFEQTPLAIKIGRIVSEAQVDVVREFTKDCDIPVVLDLSFQSKSGHERTSKKTIDLAMKLLIKDTTLLMLNHQEAQTLSKMTVFEPRSMCEAAKAIYDIFGVNTLISGGHLDRIIRDMYFDGSCSEFGADHIKGQFFGTGDTFSSLITAALASSNSVGDGIAESRELMSIAISNSHKVGDWSIVMLP